MQRYARAEGACPGSGQPQATSWVPTMYLDCVSRLLLRSVYDKKSHLRSIYSQSLVILRLFAGPVGRPRSHPKAYSNDRVAPTVSGEEGAPQAQQPLLYALIHTLPVLFILQQTGFSTISTPASNIGHRNYHIISISQYAYLRNRCDRRRRPDYHLSCLRANLSSWSVFARLAALCLEPWLTIACRIEVLHKPWPAMVRQG